jgi:hypothetical protein
MKYFRNSRQNAVFVTHTPQPMERPASDEHVDATGLTSVGNRELAAWQWQKFDDEPMQSNI